MPVWKYTLIILLFGIQVLKIDIKGLQKRLILNWLRYNHYILHCTVLEFSGFPRQLKLCLSNQFFGEIRPIARDCPVFAISATWIFS